MAGRRSREPERPMITKERIIQEIQRLAQKLGGKGLNQNQFELHSTIPVETVKYHLGSWEQALKQADLTPVSDEKARGQRQKSSQNKQVKSSTVNEEKLLMELIRIYNKIGEEPTVLTVDTQGKYGEHLYRKYWKSLDEALLQARKSFPEKFNIKSGKSGAVSIEDAQMSLEEYNVQKQPGRAEEEMVEEQKIKFIPQTIKPKQVKKRPRTLGESIKFRGLRFAPADKKGVIFLFGIVAPELGFVIESLSPEFPDCDARRCVDLENNQWEHIRIQFEYRCSEVQESELLENGCDLIVCWIHDHKDCPTEVLELKSEMDRFEDFLRE
jgi:hypothetical protein